MEVIVIIFILLLLASFFLTTRRGARIASRKTQCINNQHNISLALLRYEMTRQHYPGWRVNQDAEGFGGREATWVFPLLPYLDRTDIYNHHGAQGTPAEHLKLLVCPDDVESTNNGTSMTYVVNTGYYQDAYPYRSRREHPALGVFTSQYRASPEEQITRMSAVDVTDGLAQTLMVSENIDAGTWLGRPAASDTTNRIEEGCVGFAWLGSRPIPKINAETGSQACGLPRPSSYHSGSVVVAFCDGQTQPLRENIDTKVFALLCTPQRGIVDFEYQPLAPQRKLRTDEYQDGY